MIIAIDGPAGSGKSSTARAVAERLGFRYLDSGAFYRALALAALESGIPVDSWQTLDRAALDTFGVDAVPAGAGFTVRIDGREVGSAIRSPEVTANVSVLAKVPAVRDWLMDRLREAGRTADLVADGRDIGTVVFPDAELKIFLVADPRVRAERRLRQMGQPIDAAAVDAEVARIEARDRIDSERDVAPLKPAEDAVHEDTTSLTFEEQVERIAELARQVAAR